MTYVMNSYANIMCSASTISFGNPIQSYYEPTLQEKPKEKHFCKYCHTNSEKTNAYGGCVACGAPFGEDKPDCAWGITYVEPRVETMGEIIKRIEEESPNIEDIDIDSPYYEILRKKFRNWAKGFLSR